MPRSPWFLLVLGVLLGLYVVPKLRSAIHI